MSEKLAYRPTEAQAALGISHGQFWKLVKSQAIETKKMGRATIITAEALHKFLANLPKTTA